MKLLIIPACFCCVPLAAQFHPGVKAGVPVTAITETTARLQKTLPRWWTVGPMLELDLPVGFGIEADVLYRKVGYASLASGEEHNANLWDFPLIAKYKFHSARIRPSIGAGWTYRHLNELLQFDRASGSNGATVSLGTRIHFFVLKVAPEFRYTRWRNVDVQPAFKTSSNQIEFLIGVTF